MPKAIRDPIRDAIFQVASEGHVEIMDYILKMVFNNKKYVNAAMYTAGYNGNQKFIDYLISKGADNYKNLIVGAVLGKKIEVFKKYMDKPDVLNQQLFLDVVKSNNLEIIKIIADKLTINEKDTVNILKQLPTVSIEELSADSSEELLPDSIEELSTDFVEELSTDSDISGDSVSS